MGQNSASPPPRKARQAGSEPGVPEFGLAASRSTHRPPIGGVWLGGATGAVVLVAIAVLALQPHRPSRGIPAANATAPTSPVGASCAPSTIGPRLREFFNAVNSGNRVAIASEISSAGKLEYFQLPGLQQPTPPGVAQAVTTYFLQLHDTGTAFAVESVTTGPIDASGNRGFGYKVRVRTADGSSKPVSMAK